MENIFDLILGLPLHPLIDHVVVIFLPVFSMALIASFFFTNIRKKYGLLIQAGLGISAVSAFVAKQSGEALSMRIGTPIQHANLGSNLVLISFALFATSVVWFYLQRNSNSSLTKASGIVSVLLAIAALVFTVLVGHTGAKATWDQKINPKPIAPETSSSSQDSNAQTTDNTEAITLNATEVAKHNNENDCWTIVDNQVYDLTPYVTSHPGGVPNILRLCGVDGSQAFQSQHGNQGRPNSELSRLVIGSVGQVLNSTTTQSDSTTNSSATTTQPTPTKSTKTSSGNLTSDEVALHNSVNDCWTVVNNQVYNLTSYVYSHPGGVGNIELICGKDGSNLFLNQHGNQSRPNNVLSGFLLGNLVNGTSKLSTPNAPLGGEHGDYEGGEHEGDDD